METKMCSKCKEEKDISNFSKKYITKSGMQKYQTICKDCVNKFAEEYRNREDVKERTKIYDKNRDKDVIKIKHEKYYKENIEKILEKKSEYRTTEEYKVLNKKWRDENKELLKNNMRKYKAKNPHVIAWRTIVYSTYRRFDKSKESHTIDILGYSALELKDHLSSLFLPGMSWENHGEWHIDHIKPVSSYSINSDISEVCALSNLRPMWATTRLVDGIVYEGNLNKRDKY